MDEQFQALLKSAESVSKCLVPQPGITTSSDYNIAYLQKVYRERYKNPVPYNSLVYNQEELNAMLREDDEVTEESESGSDSDTSSHQRDSSLGKTQ